MSFISFSDQVQSFLTSQLPGANPPLQKAIDRAQQIISHTKVEELSPQQSLQCMRKVSSCFKDCPKEQEQVQDFMHTELEKMKDVEEKGFAKKRLAREVEEPSAKRRKEAAAPQEPMKIEEAEKETISRKRVREGGVEGLGPKKTRLELEVLTSAIEKKEAQAREYVSKGVYEEAFKLRSEIAHIALPADHPLADMEQAIVKGSEGKPLSRMGAYFQGLDTGCVKMGTIHAQKRRIVENSTDPNEVPKETLWVDFYLTHWMRDELEKTIQLIQSHAEDLEKISGYQIRILPEKETMIPRYIENRDVYVSKRGKWVGTQIDIEIGGIGKICIHADKEQHSLYNRVEIILNAQGNQGSDGLKNLHTILSFCGLGTTLCPSRTEDEMRIKIFILLHAFFPSLSYQMERDPENYSISIEQLRQKIGSREPQANVILKKYIDENPELFLKEELYSGRSTYMLKDMGDLVGTYASGLFFGKKSNECDCLSWEDNPSVAQEKFRNMASTYAQELKAGVTQYSNREAWLCRGDVGKGSSPDRDLNAGGFDSVFTRLSPKAYVNEKDLSSIPFCCDGIRVLVDADVMGYASCYAHSEDRFGARTDEPFLGLLPYATRPGVPEFARQMENTGSEEMKGGKFKVEKNEVMIRDFLPTKFMRAILVKRQVMKDILIEEFRKAGLIQEREGRECVVLPGCIKPVDEFFYVGNVLQEKMWAKPVHTS